MIGVAVVSLFTVFGASLKATMDQTVSRSFAGDVAVSTPSFGAGGSGLSPELAPAIARQPAVRYAVGLGRGVAQVDGRGRALTVTDPVILGKVFDLGEVRGSLGDLGTDGIALTRKEAAELHLTTGDTARLTFTDGKRENFTVRAVYGRSELVGDYVITRAAWAPHRTQDSDSLVAVTFKNGVGAADGKAAVEKVAARYGNPEVQTRDEYARSSAGGIDMMLTLVYALLALAVLIALLGIANTLTLAIHERTRELGLLRAVGQTRRSCAPWSAGSRSSSPPSERRADSPSVPSWAGCSSRPPTARRTAPSPSRSRPYGSSWWRSWASRREPSRGCARPGGQHAWTCCAPSPPSDVRDGVTARSTGNGGPGGSVFGPTFVEGIERGDGVSARGLASLFVRRKHGLRHRGRGHAAG